MITEIVEKIMRNGILRFAELGGVSQWQSQIIIASSDERGTPAYRSALQGHQPKAVTFNEILNVKFDLLNREAIASPFIQQSLLRFAQEMGIDVTRVFVIAYLRKNHSIGLTLYNGAQAVRVVDLSELLSQPQMS